MLQKASHRAARISHPAHVMVTAAEAHRSHWQRAPLRALRVAHCGWNSLSSTEAIERVTAPQPDPPNSATNAAIRALCNRA
jgi:hypothetical protein